MDALTNSHAALVTLVREQQATIAALEVRIVEQQTTIARLEHRIRDLEGGVTPPRWMPGHKPTPASAKGDRPPRAKRTLNLARQRATPDARVTHALAVCPDCGAPLAGGSTKRTREVIDLASQPAIASHPLVEPHLSGRRSVPGDRHRLVSDGVVIDRGCDIQDGGNGWPDVGVRVVHRQGDDETKRHADDEECNEAATAIGCPSTPWSLRVRGDLPLLPGMCLSEKCLVRNPSSFRVASRRSRSCSAVRGNPQPGQKRAAPGMDA